MLSLMTGSCYHVLSLHNSTTMTHTARNILPWNGEQRRMNQTEKTKKSDSDNAHGIKNNLVILGKGLCMGAADIVPGVSGGTIALVLGIYKPFIAGLKSLTLRPLKPLLGILFALIIFNSSTRRRYYSEFKKELDLIDLPFLVPLGTGMALALFAGSRFIPGMMERHPAPTFAFFGGLILYSIRIPFRLMKTGHIQPKHADNGASSAIAPGRSNSGHLSPRILLGHVLIILAAALLSWLFTGLQIQYSEIAGTAARSSHVYVFICGIISISAMILPGVSGSFVLLFLGQYRPVLDALRGSIENFHRLILALPQSADFMALSDEVGFFYLLSFIFGLVIGIFLFSRAMHWLLSKYMSQTMAALTGLMTGSLRLPAAEILATDIAGNYQTAFWTATAFIFSIILIHTLEKKA